MSDIQTTATSDEDAATRRPATRWWLTLDAVAVLAFVVIGRRTHQESQGLDDVIETAAPFMWGLLAGWLLARAWRHPLAWRTGVVVVAATYAGGMVLRKYAYGDGTAMTFVVITGVFLAVTMLGWRLVVWAARSRRSA